LSSVDLSPVPKEVCGGLPRPPVEKHGSYRGQLSPAGAVSGAGAVTAETPRKRVQAARKQARICISDAATKPGAAAGTSGQERELEQLTEAWPKLPRQGQRADDGEEREAPERAGWWAVKRVRWRVVHGLAHRVDRIEALGDGQVPAVAALAWRLLNI
jgi:hypothetical protein